MSNANIANSPWRRKYLLLSARDQAAVQPLPGQTQALLIKHEHWRIAEFTRCRERFAEAVRTLEAELVPLAERQDHLAARASCQLARD
jgi:hypothetical protein